MKIRTYSELRQLETMRDRFNYLVLRGNVAERTFGSDRWINQRFYQSIEWRTARRNVIARDLGCDLGLEGYEIHEGLYVHHMNPMAVRNISEGDSSILDPEYLITVTHTTHNAIHYGDERMLPREPTVRRPGDTKLW